MKDGNLLKGNSTKNTNSKRAIGPFDRIAIEGNFQVYLYAGKEDSISVEAPTQIHKQILTKVENGKLTVKMKPRSWFSNTYKDWNSNPKKLFAFRWIALMPLVLAVLGI